MLTIEHGLHLLIGQRSKYFLDVIAQANRNANSELVTATVSVHIHQTGIQLVPVIERHPAAVEIEARGANLAAHDFREDFLAVDDRAVLAFAGEAGDITIALL